MKRLSIVLILTLFPLLLSSQEWYGGYYGYPSVESEIATSIKQTMDGGYILAGYTSVFGKPPSYDYDFMVIKINSTGDVEWQKRFGGTQNELECTIVQTTDGSYILVGGSGSFSPYLVGGIVIKLDTWGNIIWQKHITAPPSGIIIQYVAPADDGGIVVCGTYYGEYADYYNFPWIAKLDSSGNIEWQYAVGIENPSPTHQQMDYFNKIIKTSDGGYLAMGRHEDYVGCGTASLFLLKITNEGTMQWQKTYYSGYPASVIETENHNFVIADDYYDIFSVDNNGNPLWSKSFLYPDTSGDTPDNEALINLPSNGFLVVGRHDLPGYGGLSPVIFQMSEDGSVQWGKLVDNFGGVARSVYRCIDGDIIVAGASVFGAGGGGFDFAVSKINTSSLPPCFYPNEDYLPLPTDLAITFCDFNLPAINVPIEVSDPQIIPKDPNVEVVKGFCPIIDSVKILHNPFRLKIKGSNLYWGYYTEVRINGVPVPETKCKSSHLAIAKGGTALKAMLPKGQSICIQYSFNRYPDDPYESECFEFTR